LNTIVLYIKL